jgi:hypothetical protein
MNRIKCTACGLVNFAGSETCRRCSAALMSGYPELQAYSAPRASGRGLGRWLLFVLGASLSILITSYLSLLVSSEGVTREERQMVLSAVDVLEKAGFEREVFMLRRVVNYRRTDNWWNQYVGHQTAYASTNFPFAVVTLYPTFFKYPVDDIERATILLHEAQHVLGEPEEIALQRVWIEKQRLGWTSLRYSHTRVWKNTVEWTSAGVPALFRCGPDQRSDCLE